MAFSLHIVTGNDAIYELQGLLACYWNYIIHVNTFTENNTFQKKRLQKAAGFHRTKR
jgi:hypothetical protein